MSSYGDLVRFFFDMFGKIARGQVKKRRRRRSKPMLVVGADDPLPPALEMRHMWANGDWLYKHCMLDTPLTRRHYAKRQRYDRAAPNADSSSDGEQ